MDNEWTMKDEWMMKGGGRKMDIDAAGPGAEARELQQSVDAVVGVNQGPSLL